MKPIDVTSSATTELPGFVRVDGSLYRKRGISREAGVAIALFVMFAAAVITLLIVS